MPEFIIPGVVQAILFMSATVLVWWLLFYYSNDRLENTRIGDILPNLHEWYRTRPAKKQAKIRLELEREREQLQAKLTKNIERLTELENMMRFLTPETTPDELVRYMNDTGIQHWKHAREQMFLDKEDGDGVWPEGWLARYFKRDIIGQRWYLEPDDDLVLLLRSELSHRLGQQHRFWIEMRDSVRGDCMAMQEDIDSLSERLGIKKDPDALTSPDKRTALKQVRVRVAELRLDEERIEQEILKEQGGDGPHRRSGGVPTDD